ncbi:ABC transporter permease (plasmid) [Embleya sp. NBC_00888]|uniref:ABC transporter permease n=1 Tax=Embleya sp. NBC_00888 TaxID=2975960 RepID=UPI002F919859|nr:ABC transporter permease [Embleya sp. NBC_00888]
MTKHILLRLLRAAGVVVLVTIAAAALPHLMQGSPALAALGTSATPEQIAAFNAEIGLDENVLTATWHWIIDALHGDLGTSLANGVPVTTELTDRVPVTLELFAAAQLVALASPCPSPCGPPGDPAASSTASPPPWRSSGSRSPGSCWAWC